MIVYIVIEQEFGMPSNLLACFDHINKANAFIDAYPQDDFCGYSVKPMEISREVSKALLLKH